MELVAIQTYREPSFELWPGDDTIGKDISDEHKKRMLEDFPEKLQVIEDVDKFVKEKAARLAAEAEKRMQEIMAQYEDTPADIFKSDPMTSKEDSFVKDKDFEPESKEKDLEIETPESKQPKGKRK